jgi:hypothetical protein
MKANHGYVQGEVKDRLIVPLLGQVGFKQRSHTINVHDTIGVVVLKIRNIGDKCGTEYRHQSKLLYKKLNIIISIIMQKPTITILNKLNCKLVLSDCNVHTFLIAIPGITESN